MFFQIGYQRFPPIYNDDRGSRGGMDRGGMDRGGMDRGGMERRGRRNWNEQNEEGDGSPRNDERNFSRHERNDRRAQYEDNNSGNDDTDSPPVPERRPNIPDDDTWDEEIESRWKDSKAAEEAEAKNENTIQNNDQMQENYVPPDDENNYGEPKTADNHQDTAIEPYITNEHFEESHEINDIHVQEPEVNNAVEHKEQENTANAENQVEPEGATTPLCDE